MRCDFVDAGDGKECSDVKIRGTSNLPSDPRGKKRTRKISNADSIRIAQFEQDIIDVHCLHILFCASADNGYARVLGPYRNTKDQITLVEGPPFAREIKELTSSFSTTSFPEVFRAQKLSRYFSTNSTPATLTNHGHRHRHRPRHSRLELCFNRTSLYLPLSRQQFSLFLPLSLSHNAVRPKHKIQI